MKSYSNSIAFLALVAAFLGLGVTFGQEEHGSKKAFIAYVRDYDNRYANSLEGVDNDANKLADVLGSLMGFVNTRFSNTAADGMGNPKTGSRDSFEKVFERWIKSVRKGDTVVVYLTGHGVLDDEGNVHYAFGNIKGENNRAINLEEASYSMEKLRDKLDQCPAKSKLLILDCCHAGATRNQRNANALHLARSSEAAAVFEDVGSVTTLASSQGDEYSLMLPEKNHSLFTYWLLYGLRGYADSDLDGKITLKELMDYVSSHVRDQTPNQTPKLIASNKENEIFFEPRSELTMTRTSEIAILLAEAVKKYNKELSLVIPEFSFGDNINQIALIAGGVPKRIAHEVSRNYEDLAGKENSGLKIIPWSRVQELSEAKSLDVLGSQETRSAFKDLFAEAVEDTDPNQVESVAIVKGNLQLVGGYIAKVVISCVDLENEKNICDIRCRTLLDYEDLISLGSNFQRPQLLLSPEEIQRDIDKETDPQRRAVLIVKKELAERLDKMVKEYIVTMTADYEKNEGKSPGPRETRFILEKARDAAVAALFSDQATGDPGEAKNPLESKERYCEISFRTRPFREDRPASDNKYESTNKIIFENDVANFYLKTGDEFAIQIENVYKQADLIVSVLVDGRDTLFYATEEQKGGLGPRREEQNDYKNGETNGYQANGLWLVERSKTTTIKGFTNRDTYKSGSFLVKDLNTDVNNRARTTFGDQNGVITVIVWENELSRGDRGIEVGKINDVKITSKTVKRGRLLAKYSIYYNNKD